VLLGAAASAARLWWLRRPLKVLRAAKDDPEALRNLGKVYRFSSTTEVRDAGLSPQPCCARRCNGMGMPLLDRHVFVLSMNN
jgi:hypothetical protein